LDGGVAGGAVGQLPLASVVSDASLAHGGKNTLACIGFIGVQVSSS
jgi:hypothetical protein